MKKVVAAWSSRNLGLTKGREYDVIHEYNSELPYVNHRPQYTIVNDGGARLRLDVSALGSIS